MIFYTDHPSIRAELDRYFLVQKPEQAPRDWKRLYIFYDDYPLNGYDTFKLDDWMRWNFCWSNDMMNLFVHDGQMCDSAERSIFCYCNHRWHTVLITCSGYITFYRLEELPYQNLRDGDIILCPSTYYPEYDFRLDCWHYPAKRAKEIEDLIEYKTGERVILAPPPLTHDDLLERLISLLLFQSENATSSETPPR